MNDLKERLQAAESANAAMFHKIAVLMECLEILVSEVRFADLPTGDQAINIVRQRLLGAELRLQ